MYDDNETVMTWLDSASISIPVFTGLEAFAVRTRSHTTAERGTFKAGENVKQTHDEVRQLTIPESAGMIEETGNDHFHRRG
ncbi:hypothetical protein AcW1_009789 [Taiwanofungus camphoratus]|nr:hypothetical protein AcW1_009789 [Antrodia cinnamomea]